MSGPTDAKCLCGSGKRFSECHGADRFGGVARKAFIVIVGCLFLGITLIWLLPPPSHGEVPPVAKPRMTSYADLPGVDLTQLTPGTRLQFINHLNHAPCGCACDMTVAECRNIDPGCEHSTKIVNDQLAQLLRDPA